MRIVNWNELVIHTSNDAQEPVSNILNEFGANGVVLVDPADLYRKKRDVYGELYALDPKKYPVNGVILKAYFMDNHQWQEKYEAIQQAINQLVGLGIDLGPNDLTVNLVQEEDWENEWKKYFKPEKVSDQLVIVPSWEQYDAQAHEKIITIDPGMAFGTGTHPTTVLSLQSIEKVIHPGNVVIDVGSGSGILSIASILLGAGHVYSYDLDEVAVNSTIANRNLNGFKDQITVQQNDLLKDVSIRADVIVSNILADILLRVIEDAWNNLTDNGYFITSGIIVQKADKVQKAMEEHGFIIVERKEQNKWISFIAQKRV